MRSGRKSSTEVIRAVRPFFLVLIEAIFFLPLNRMRPSLRMRVLSLNSRIWLPSTSHFSEMKDLLADCQSDKRVILRNKLGASLPLNATKSQDQHHMTKLVGRSLKYTTRTGWKQNKQQQRAAAAAVAAASGRESMYGSRSDSSTISGSCGQRQWCQP